MVQTFEYFYDLFGYVRKISKNGKKETTIRGVAEYEK